MIAKHDNTLIVNLLDELKKRNVKIPQFSKDTGIPKDRVYKWIQEGNNPKADDEKKIIAWIKEEKPPQENSKAEKYPEAVDHLAEAIAIIKKQNDFMQKMLESSLVDLSRDVNNNAAAIRAEIRGYGKYNILKGVNWDDAEFAKAMAVVDKIYGAELKADDLQDNS